MTSNRISAVIYFVAFLAFIVSVQPFPIATFLPKKNKSCGLHMGLFDFDALRGSGSGKEMLDEEWRKQQEILEARKKHGTKDYLKNKYKKQSLVQNTASGKITKERPAKIEVETESPKHNSPKFFWEK